MQRSLPERLVERQYPAAMLLVQRRMAAGMSSFASLMFYQGRLKDGPGTALKDRPLAGAALRFFKDVLEVTIPSQEPVLFVDVKDSACLTGQSKSRLNYHNAVVGMWLLNKMFATMPQLKGEDVRIVTPYTLQSRLYKSAIAKLAKQRPDRGISKLRVSTTASIQGGEGNIVIL